MFEGASFTGQEDQVAEEPFDYLKLHQERIEQERAEKDEAQRAKKEAEKAKKEKRIADKMAEKAKKADEKAEKITKKSEKLKKDTENTKDEVESAKEELKQATEVVNEAVLPAPVEMVMGEGSEYRDDELKEGAEAIFNLEHEVEQVEATIDLATEVSERAEVIAKARAALAEVESGDVGTPVSDNIESGPLYDLGVAQDEIKDRLKETWGLNDDKSVNQAEQTVLASDTSNLGEISGDWSPATMSETYHQPKPNRTEATFKPFSFSRRLRNSAVLAGSVFGFNRLNNTARDLAKANQQLQKKTEDLKRDIEVMQSNLPKQLVTHEVPGAQSSSILPAPMFETTRSTASITPDWIRQLEVEIKKGKLSDLKKWQIDILRTQYPELLRSYQKLDGEAKQYLKESAKEVKNPTASKKPSPEVSYVSDRTPGLPAFMNPKPLTSTSLSELSSVNYSSVSSSNGSVLSNNQLGVMLIGGVLLGVVLIAVFG